MKRAIPIGIILAILGAFVYTLVFLYDKSQAKPVLYQTESPLITDITKKTVATGSIVPRREVEIKPRVSGVLEELYLEAGQDVKEGQAIAKIKIVPNMVSLNTAEASVSAAQISFDNAKAEFERNKTLYAQQVISQTELNRFKLEFELHRQELNAARNNLQLIKTGAAKGSGKVSNVVTSTVTGTVIDVPIKVGASVTETNNFNPGTTIAFVADMGDMIFEGRVDESEVGKIKEGMELDITIGAIEDKRFKGTLEYVSPKGVMFEGTIQFEIRAALARVEGVFVRAGYSANADIVLGRATQVLAIDEALLQFDKERKPFVEVEVAPQKFERRDVDLGISDGLLVEVTSGVAPGDKLKAPERKGRPSGPPH